MKTTCPTTKEFRNIYNETKKLTSDRDLRIETHQWVNGKWRKILITSTNGGGVLFSVDGKRISRIELQYIIG